jgi:hypothetical protein
MKAHRNACRSIQEREDKDPSSAALFACITAAFAETPAFADREAPSAEDPDEEEDLEDDKCCAS